MNNFTFYTPTKIVFGKDSIKDLHKLIKGKYKKVLLHYGQNSVIKSGLYDETIRELEKANIEYITLGGVSPNPKLSLVRVGIELAKKENVDFILAIGGGSAIDSGKAIAVGAVSDKDVWEYFMGREKLEKALPVGVVLTIPATGSEASTSTVVSNEELGLKLGLGSDMLRPVFAIMDPTYTLTLPEKQTFAGVMDILSHIFERYFTKAESVDFTNYLAEATMKCVIKNALLLKEDPNNYDARAEIMIAGTFAHNGLLGLGRQDDWSSHAMAHQLSAMYGETHGVTLAIIFPAWMKYVYKEKPSIFAQFANNVFNIEKENKTDEELALEGIKAFEEFLKKIGLPRTFTEAKIPTDAFEQMAKNAVVKGAIGAFRRLEKEDVEDIYKLAK